MKAAGLGLPELIFQPLGLLGSKAWTGPCAPKHRSMPGEMELGTGSEVSCLGTTNPFASRGWVAWQLLLVGLSGLALVLSGGPGSWDSTPTAPAEGQSPTKEPRKEQGTSVVTPTGCRHNMLSAHKPVVPGRLGMRPFCRGETEGK